MEELAELRGRGAAVQQLAVTRERYDLLDVLVNADGRATVIPVHPGETIGPGLMGKMLRDTELTCDELVELL